MKRGRKSADDLNVIVGDFGKQIVEPPAGMTSRQAEIWRSVIASEATGFFSTAVLQAMLADYCRHRESGEAVSAIIGSFQADWIKSSEGAKRYKMLIQMRELETRAATTLATKLRLTNQSRYFPQTAARAANNAATTQGSKPPWEI